ncbi:MAG: DUF1376 domain-containing protein [Rhodospirillales bacterium]|nr:DUF1376 domain-containing protein [Rhodospirillales bacterium]
MTGLAWFPMYPRNWLVDTRVLSDRARGFYADILCAIYARGGPLPFNGQEDEDELRKLGGYKQVRTMRAVLDELLSKEKLHLINGHLVNNRAMEELAIAARHRANGAKGGRPPKANGGFIPNKLDVSGVGIVEKQWPNQNPTQSHTVSKETAPGAYSDEEKIEADSLRVVIFSTCRKILTERYAMDDGKARRILGGLRKDHADGEIVDAFTRLQAKPDIQDPIPWLKAVLKAAKPNGTARPTAPAIGTPEAEQRAREWGYR